MNHVAYYDRMKELNIENYYLFCWDECRQRSLPPLRIAHVGK